MNPEQTLALKVLVSALLFLSAALLTAIWSSVVDDVRRGDRDVAVLGLIMATALTVALGTMAYFAAVSL